MSRDGWQTILRLGLLTSGVAVVVALAWWSLLVLVLVVLTALFFGVVGWMYGYQAGVLDQEQRPPTTRRRTPSRARGGTKR